MAKIQNTDTTKRWWGRGATETLIHCYWECKIVQPHWKIVEQFLAKLNILLPYNPAIELLGTYPKELKTYVHAKIYTDIYSILIPNYQNWEAIKMSFSR